MTIFAVSSLRDYGDGEIYFGTDGIFNSREDAMEYIRRDLRETMENYNTVYEPETSDPEIEWEGDDYADVRVTFDGHTFLWRIDQFAIKDEEAEE